MWRCSPETQWWKVPFVVAQLSVSQTWKWEKVLPNYALQIVDDNDGDSLNSKLNIHHDICIDDNERVYLIMKTSSTIIVTETDAKQQDIFHNQWAEDASPNTTIEIIVFIIINWKKEDSIYRFNKSYNNGPSSITQVEDG